MSSCWQYIFDKKPSRPSVWPNDKSHVSYSENLPEFKRLNSAGWGIYKAANEFEATDAQIDDLWERKRKNDQDSKRPTKRNKEFLTRLVSVYGDLDIAKAGDGKTREQKEAAKQSLIESLNSKCKPSRIIVTSNGIQPLWDLSAECQDPINAERYVRVIHGIVEWSESMGCHGDSVWDVTRVLRVPGFNHMKEEPYMVTVQEFGGLFTLDDLEKAFPFHGEIKAVSKKEAKSVAKADTYKGSDVKKYSTDKVIEMIDIRDIAIRVQASIGRKLEFDANDEIILDGRKTGGFQRRVGDRQFLETSSHEPYSGTKIGYVMDVLGNNTTHKQARQWIIDEFGITEDGANSRIRAVRILSAKQEKEIDDGKRFTWGTDTLNRRFALIKTGNFIVFTGESGGGKTTYTFDMSLKNASLGHKVVYLSLEMSKHDLISDRARRFSGITVGEEFDKEIPKGKSEAFARKYSEIENWPNIDYQGYRRSEEIDSSVLVEIIKEKHRVAAFDILVLDNMNLIGVGGLDSDMDKQKVVTRALMGLAQELKIVVILIHHYRKKSSQSSARGMDDLSGSASIFQGADRVIHIMSKHNQKLKEKKEGDPMVAGEDDSLVTLYLEKARGYQPCIEDVVFDRGTYIDKPKTKEEKAQEAAKEVFLKQTDPLPF